MIMSNQIISIASIPICNDVFTSTKEKKKEKEKAKRLKRTTGSVNFKLALNSSEILPRGTQPRFAILFTAINIECTKYDLFPRH